MRNNLWHSHHQYATLKKTNKGNLMPDNKKKVIARFSIELKGIHNLDAICDELDQIDFRKVIEDKIRDVMDKNATLKTAELTVEE